METIEKLNKIIMQRVSCRICGEIFCGTTPEKAKAKHAGHIKDCKILKFWEKTNKILGKELTAKEVFELLGIKRKYKKKPVKKPEPKEIKE